MKKKLIFIGLLLLFGFMGFSQDKFTYIYDDNGNRSLRSVITMSGGPRPNGNARIARIDTIVVASNSYKLYPNPVEGQLTIEFEKFENKGYSFLLIDISGRVVNEGVVVDRVKKIDMSELSSGIYLLSVMVNGEKKEWKIVKN